MRGAYVINAFLNLPKIAYFALIKRGIKFQSPILKASSGAHFQCTRAGVINVGLRVVVQRGSQVEADGGIVSLGNDVYINRNCSIVSREQIYIGSQTTIGPNVSIYDHDHIVQGVNTEHDCKSPIVIGANVWIGANTVILKGVAIGEGSIISAGSVVTHDVPRHTMLIQKRSDVLREIGA